MFDNSPITSRATVVTPLRDPVFFQLMNLAEKDPFAVLRRLGEFADQRWNINGVDKDARDILARAIDTEAAKLKSSTAYEFYRFISDLGVALRTYGDRPWASEVIRRAVERDSDSYSLLAIGIVKSGDRALISKLDQWTVENKQSFVESSPYFVGSIMSPYQERILSLIKQKQFELETSIVGVHTYDPEFAFKLVKASFEAGDVIPALSHAFLFSNTSAGKALIREIFAKFPGDGLNTAIFPVRFPRQGVDRNRSALMSINDPIVNDIFRLGDKIEKSPLFQSIARNRTNRPSYPMLELEAVGSMYYSFKDGLFSESEAITLIQPNRHAELFRRLNESIASPNASLSPKLESYRDQLALMLVRNINDLHDSPPQSRFAEISRFNSRELVQLLTFGRAEVFTSTMNGLYSRLRISMERDNVSASSLFGYLSPTEQRGFFEVLAAYGKLEPFLQLLPEDSRRAAIQNTIKGISTNLTSLADAASIADLMRHKLSNEVGAVISQSILSEAKDAKQRKDSSSVQLYGLLAALATVNRIPGSEVLNELSSPFLKLIPDQRKLSSNELFDAKTNTNTQRYYFYEDKDGIASFDNFISTYAKDASSWAIERKNGYARVSSRGAGRKIQIFANDPHVEKKGDQAIDLELSKTGTKATIVVHRGHSFYAEQTIERLKEDTKLVFLGGCGGFTLLWQATKLAPNAQIVSTQGEGTKFVNDPLLKYMNRELLAGKDLDWEHIQQAMDKRFEREPRWLDYLLPMRNSTAHFLKAYRDISRETN